MDRVRPIEQFPVALTRIEIGLNVSNLKHEFENIDIENLNEDHPLKLIDLNDIIPDEFDLPSIIGLKNRNLFIMFFVKYLASENSFFTKLKRELMTKSFESFFSFLEKYPEYMDCFEIQDDQRYS